MRIRSNFICLATSGVAFALFAAGCAMQPMDDEGGDPTKIEEDATAADFDFAPDAVESVTDKDADKAEAELSAKGSWSTNMTRGAVFHRNVTVARGQTITCETSQYGSKSMDTVLALIRRDDGYTGWLSNPNYSHQARFSTMKVDDDAGAGLYSKITWTNPGGATSFWLIGWAYGSSAGKANVTCTYSNPSDSDSWTNQTFGANSLKWNSCDQGRAYTVSSDGGDPYVLAVDKNDNGGNGYWNDDTNYPSNRESQLTSLTNQNVWYVMGGYSVGTSTLHCHY